MTAAQSRTAQDDRGSVPQDEGAALSTVEGGEAVALPSLGGLVRGLVTALAQARPVGREASRLRATAAT